MDSMHFVPSRATHLGQQFGSYRIESPLGRGAFAAVFLGRHLYLDTNAAIKILHRQFVGFERQLFSSEARMAARLVHPYIVRVLEYGVQFDRPYLVMDYAPGGSLGQFRGTRLPLTLVVHYAKQIASGLDYLNAQGIIHCDIKPQNLLIGCHEQILIGDFGIALLAGNAASQEGIIFGTPTYMAPEQIMGNPCFASDQYALAVVLYELLCGIPPFEGTRTGVIKQHLRADPPPLRKHVSIPLAVEDVIIQALAKDPERRYDSARQFAKVLELAALESSRTVHIPPHQEKSWHSPTVSADTVAARRFPSRPENKAARRFAIAAMCSGDLVAAAMIWFFSALTHNDALAAAWLVAFWLVGCAFIGAIIMKRWQALQLFACIFTLVLLSGFVFHTMLAFLVVVIILLAFSMVVTLCLSFREV
jgi:serine/threonine protein kinase